jgi:hypothetical protein
VRTRRLLLIAGVIALTLSLALVSLALTSGSAPQDQAALLKPTGPAEDAAGRAKSALAADLGVGAGKFVVESIQEQTWSDTSLGLPEPDMMYAQVETSGHVVTLSNDGQTYVYHVAGEAVQLNPGN